MGTILDQLRNSGKKYLYWRHSALAKYHGLSVWPLQIVTDASLVDLARIFPDPEFPAVPDVHMRIRWEGKLIDFHCAEDLSALTPSSFSVLNLFYNPERAVYEDPFGVYGDLREDGVCCDGAGCSFKRLADAALLLARFPYSVECPVRVDPDERRELHPDHLRSLLERILPFQGAWRAFAFLNEIGFVKRYWPELAALSGVRHDKDFHPEGDGWKHSLEALKQRKKGGLQLSLALLLHDIGKTVAGRNGDRAFDGHSELGVGIAVRFMRRMGFCAEIIDEVAFLIRHHMLPGALHRMPVSKVERIMGSELYPRLLDVYRADLLATWADDAAYHDAYRQYKRFLRHSKNPYRDVRGTVKKW